MGQKDVPDGAAFTLVGAFGVAVGGRELHGAEIGSRQARTLLKLLVVERGAAVPTDRIVDVLWAARPPRRPVNGVATLVSRLRATLGAGIISGNRVSYRLGVAVERATDLDMAAGLLRESESRFATAPALALAAAQRALAVLGGGAVLEDDLYADWTTPARTQAAALTRRARHLAAEAALEVGDAATARTIADQAIAADPLDEAAYRMVMHAGRALGEPALALVAYERLRKALATELGADPAAATRALHQAILQDRPAPAPTSTGHATANDPGLAGRADEISRLSRRWTSAAEGSVTVVLIAGEAGIGKTRLAAQAARLAEATGGIVLRARCYESERSLFLQPLVEALRPHLAATPPALLRELADGWALTLAAFLPELAQQLQVATVPPGTPGPERRRLFEAVSVLLRRLSQHTPVLVLLDDLHNAGLGTIEFLHYLARHLAGGRLLCLATVRDDEGTALLERLADVTHRIDLGPLPPDAVARLAADAGRADLADHIHRRTGGHTLFVVETLRGLSDGEPGVPASLQAAILARVRYAGPDVTDILRAAAVFGPQFQPDALAAMLAIPPFAAARSCERALQLHLVVVAGRAYEFANDVIREVLYDTTPAPTRVQHHRAAIEQLTDRPEAVAEHAAAAGDWLRAARSWLSAGEHAMGRFAASDAQALLGRALDAAERTDDVELRSRAHLVRGRAREALAAHAGAWADHQAAMGLARRAGHRRLEMLALRELGGDVPVALGHSAAACMMYLEAGERLADALGDRARQAELLARLAILATNRLRFDVAVDHGRRAVAAARASGQEHALAAALDGLKTAYAYLGEIAALEPVLDELLPLLGRRGDLWRMQWAVFESAMPAIARGDWDCAVACIERAMAVNHEAGYGEYVAWFLAHRGWVERLRGRLDDAAHHGRAAVDVASRTDHPWWLATANALLACTLLETGAVSEAVTLLEAGLAVADRSGTEAYRLRCLGPLAQATGRLDILRQADDLLGRVRAPSGAAWLPGADAYLGVARAWLARDEPARAMAAVTPLLAAAERNDWAVVRAGAAAIARRCGRADVRLTPA